MSKKIAFIGCSYAAYDVAGGFKDHWTYLLSLKYPQHTYRNYSKGGQGYDYFRFCVLDAKMWGADAIFVSSTFTGRHSLLTDHYLSDNTFEFNNLHISDNYSTHDLHQNLLWFAGGEPGSIATYPWLKRLAYAYAKNILASDTHIDYNYKWMANLDKLYNFEKIYTLDFAKDGPHHYKHQKESVWEMLWRINNIGLVKKDKLLAEYGYTVAEDDDHWSPFGHSVVLRDYILNEDVKNYLEKE